MQMRKLLLPAVMFALVGTAVIADQSERVPPTAGIISGVEYSQRIGNAVRSISSANKGSSAPANVGGAAIDGLEWLDDSSSPWLKKRYINGGWAVEGALDPATQSYIGIIGGGIATLNSGSTTDLGSVAAANVSVLGTNSISSFGSSAAVGIEKTIRFAGSLTLVNSSALMVPGGFNLVTAANDRAKVTHLGSGTWEITAFTRANGIPIDVSAVGEVKHMFSAVPALHVLGDGRALSRASYPAYLAKVTRAQSGVRTSGNATITGIGDTSGFGGGMPVEGTGIGAGCYIVGLAANTSITLNSSACVTASGTSTVTVFLTGYGIGGSSSTVGVPDCRGRFLAGRDHDVPGFFAGNLTVGYFGNATILGNVGGSEQHQLTRAELPTGITSTNASQNITVTVSEPGGRKFGGPTNPAENVTAAVVSTSGGGATVAQGALNGAWSNIASLSGTTANAISVTSNNTGGNAHSIVPPTLIAECVVRVTP